MKLFEKLDKVYVKTQDPDAIAKQLCGVGWIKPSEISEIFFEKNKRVPYVIGVWTGSEFRSASGMGGYAWYFTHCAASWREFIGSLRRGHGGDYWMIPKDEYVYGDYPCPA